MVITFGVSGENFSVRMERRYVILLCTVLLCIIKSEYQYFYNDVFRYTPEKDEWRKFVSPTCPGPRSAHAVVSSPAGGGKLSLFGALFGDRKVVKHLTAL